MKKARPEERFKQERFTQGISGEVILSIFCRKDYPGKDAEETLLADRIVTFSKRSSVSSYEERKELTP
jgi:hypothetical protein